MSSKTFDLHDIVVEMKSLIHAEKMEWQIVRMGRYQDKMSRLQSACDDAAPRIYKKTQKTQNKEKMIL